MSLRIRDYEVSFDSSNTPVGPGKLEHVQAVPSVAPLYIYNGVRWLLDQPGGRVAVPDYDDGYFTYLLPWPSESNPSTVHWQIIRANGALYSGVVPEGVLGPVSILDLVQSYGWSIVQTTETILTVQGAPGLIWEDTWNSGSLYLPTQVVFYQGSSYVAIHDNTNDPPPSSNWELLAQKGDQGIQGIQGDPGSGGSGTVTSVGILPPFELEVANSPITSSGDIGLTWTNEDANTVFAAPDGSLGTPGFRSLVAADIPDLDAAKITSGTLSDSLLPTATGSALGAIKVGTTLSILSGVLDYDLPIASTSVLGGVKQGSNVTIDGTGVISVAAPYSLPIASASVLGGIKVGANLSIDGSGILSAGNSYVLPVASASVLGGVKQGSNVTIDGSGVISVAAPYSLPIATASVLGGVKQGSNVTIDGTGVISVAAPTGGTVTSVAMTVPSELSVAGSAITTAGTLALTWANETGNSVFASPSGGGSGTPSFRSLVAADIPNLDTGKITTGTLSSARLPTADASNLGAIKVGTTLSIASGVLDYTLPTASASVLGAIKVGSGLSITSGVVSTVNNGTVTSVAMTVPTDFAISGSAITSSGTLALTWNAQTGNVVMASPSGGGSGTPTFRSLVAGDIPNLDASKITAGTLALARGGTATDNSSVAINQVWAGPSSGSTGSALYRALVANDIPNLDAGKITTGTLALARGGTNSDNTSTTANNVFAGPTSGGASSAGFRALVAADIPSLDASKLTSGSVATARLGNLVLPFYSPAGSATGAATTTGEVAYMATSGGTVFTDNTSVIQTTGIVLNYGAVNDAVYIGCTTTTAAGMFNAWNAARIQVRSWSLTLLWEYYNGTTWSSLPAWGWFNDGTSSFTGSGVPVGFLPPTDWATTSVNSVSAWWIRCRCTAFTSFTTAAKYTGSINKMSLATPNTIPAPVHGTITSVFGMTNGVAIYNQTTNVYTMIQSGGVATQSGLSIAVSAGDNIVLLSGQTGVGASYPILYCNLTPS